MRRSRAVLLAALVSLPIVPTSGATTIDLKAYGPCNSIDQTWYKSMRPNNCSVGVRYSTDINTSNHQTWCRWQFSGTADEYFDVFYWSQSPDNKLRYSATYSGCTSGMNCDLVTTFTDSVVYSPRYYTLGTIVTGSGTSAFVNDFDDGTHCTGTNEYSYTVRTMDDGEPYYVTPNTSVPMVTSMTDQSLTFDSCTPGDGGNSCSQCNGVFHYRDYNFLATACDTDADGCKPTWIATWGGAHPFSWSYPESWSLEFDKFN